MSGLDKRVLFVIRKAKKSCGFAKVLSMPLSSKKTVMRDLFFMQLAEFDGDGQKKSQGADGA